MLDILGYWFSVSVITLVFSIPFVMLSLMLYRSAVIHIMEDEWRGGEAADSLVNWSMSSGFYVKNKKVLSDGPLAALLLLSLLSYMVAFVVLLGNETMSTDFLLEIVHRISLAVAPLTGYVAVPLVMYFLTILIGRKILKLKKKIDAINEQLKEQE